MGVQATLSSSPSHTAASQSFATLQGTAPTQQMQVVENAVLQAVQEARRLGPVANDCSPEEKAAFLAHARALRHLWWHNKNTNNDDRNDDSNDNNTDKRHHLYMSNKPALCDLTGRHERLYLVTEGKKHGRIGQVFFNGTTFENTVTTGPLQLAAMANYTPIDYQTGEIGFQTFYIRLLFFGSRMMIPIRRRQARGGGTWKFLLSDPLSIPSTENANYCVPWKHHLLYNNTRVGIIKAIT